ncbi:hypothetical protein [Gelidibacter japonicus]|jgi:hypothetical protein|nr:hypothetical protein [Gelidibacter japonicus]MCL8007679.1 hypothetical protein [Gelidibacter japonicus]
MKKKKQAKEIDHFRNDFLQNSNCIIGGGGGGIGDIDRDKAGRPPTSGH